MLEHRKRIIDVFQEHLIENYEDYCRTHDSEQDISNFITYLIDHDLIQSVTIKRYAIKNEFQENNP